MDEQAEEGTEYLFNHYQLSRNSLLTIDLNGRNLEESEFPRFCTVSIFPSFLPLFLIVLCH
jgi:hypothetical protein